MSLYNPQYKDEQGNIVDLPINAKKLDGYTYNDYSKYYTTSSTTANAFLVTIPYVKALSDGLVIHCKFHTATKSGATLNVNNLGAKGIYYRYATEITTHIVANNYVDLIYSATIDKWVLLFSYDSNSNSLGYQVRTNKGVYKNGASTSCYRYQILVETKDGLGAFTSTSNSTGTSKAQLSPNYIPNGAIRYYSGTAEVKTNANFSATTLWQQYQGINLKYSFNISTITNNSPCYIKMSRNTDGTLTPVYSATSGGHPLVFALPTTKDGYYYTYLGRTYTASSVVYLELELSHPTFYYDGGIRVYDGTYIYDWAKASTKPTYTASEVGALPSDTTIPTETTVSGWGFTKNLGTVTKVNSISPDSSGNVEIDIPKTISTQDIRITDLQAGTYVLTYSGKIRLYWNGAESDDYVEHLQTWSNNWNPILVVNTKYSSSSGTSWFWQCYNFISLGWNFKGKVTPSGNAYTSWTDCKYFVEYIYPDTQLGSKTKPIYLIPSTSGGYSSSEQAYKTAIAMDCDEYAGGTSVTLNGTSKSATTASFYAPTGAGTSGQFLKSGGLNASPTWETVTIPTKSSWDYDDMYVKYTASQSLTDAQKSQARSNIGAGTSSFTGYTSSNKLHTDYINNAAGWTSNKGTVTSIRVQAGTGLSSSTSTAQTSTLDTTISIADGYKLLTNSEYNTLNAKQDKISVGTNGQLLSSNGSSLVWTDDNRSLLHHDLGVFIENTTTDKGWKMFNSSYNGFLLKSVRFNANSPDWGVGNFGSGIVFGGADTKGVMSVAYGTPDIKFAGGNGEGPRWWIKLTGTSTKTYDLDKLSSPNEAAVQVSGTISAGAKNNASITLVITNTSKPLKKGVWRYSGTHGVFLIFATTEITTMGSPRTAYICGYVSSQISNNTSLTLVEV